MHPLVATLHAEIPVRLRPFVSIESLLDKAIRRLIGTLVQKGSFTKQEQRDYDELTMERVRRMTPRRPYSKRR